MENKQMYSQLTDLMNDAREGKITVGKFRETAEELYGVKLPELGQDALSIMVDTHWFMKKSDISLPEYLRRAEIILDALSILESEHVAERDARSGKLNV